MMDEVGHTEDKHDKQRFRPHFLVCLKSWYRQSSILQLQSPVVQK